MKKPLIFGVFTFFIIGLSLNVFAQNTGNRLPIPDSLLSEKGYDSLSSSSYLSSGVLWDKAIPRTNLLRYQGFNDSDTAKGMEGFQAYLDLYHATVNYAALISYDSLRDLYRSQLLGQDALPIMTFAYDYQYLKPMAFDSNYISIVDSQLVVDNTSVNPFESNTFWQASTRFKEVPVNETFQIVIPSALFFQNPLSDGYNILSLEIDLDDGSGYQSISYDQPLNVLYTGEGGSQKTISIKWNTTSGPKYANLLWKTAAGCSNVPSTDIAPWPDLDLTFNYYKLSGDHGNYQIVNTSSTVTVKNLFEASIPFAGKKAKGKAYIRYRDNATLGQNTFKKPVIFVEGLDLGPDGGAPFRALMARNYSPVYGPVNSNKVGNTGWPQLWGCNDDGLFDTARSYLDDLSSQGYDIIMLDFWDGADYIQRNAFLLVELIERINANKVGDESNIIIGASMGGQVVRYALSYMEDKNIPHCTRLNVSFDSPWNGAHIPLSLQCFLDYSANHGQNAAAIETLNGLHRPAPKQLLNYHIWKAKNSYRTIQNTGNSQKTITFNFNNKLATCPEREQLIAELNNLGSYPRKCRNIAIVNGNRFGVPEFPAGQQFIDHNNDLCWFFSVQNDLWAGKGGTAYIAKLNTGKGADKHFYKVKNMLPIYNAPSSLRDDMTDIYKGIKDGLSDLNCGTSNVHLIHSNQGFIPSVSALAVNTSNWHLDLKTNIDPNNPSFNQLSPFDAYYAPGASRRHVMTTTKNMDFFMKEVSLGVDVLGQDNGNVLTKVWNNPFENAALPGIDINSNGVLFLNADRPYYEGGEQRPTSENNSLSRVFLGALCNSSKIIQINQGGKLELGANNTSNKKAYLYIQEGAEVNLNSGGSLVINPGSKVIVQEGGVLRLNDEVKFEAGQIQVEDGGELIFDSQASFSHNQYGSSVLIQGKLSVKAGAVITANSNGVLIFDQDIPWVNVNNQLVRDIDSYLDIEPGAKLHLIGLNPSFKNQTLLEIRNETILKDADQDIFDEVIIQNGAVDIAPNAFLFVSSPIDVIDAEVRSSQGGQVHGGMRIWNNSTINYFRRVTIKEGNPGVLVSGPGAIGHTEFRDCIVQNNFDGLKWNGGFHVVRNCQFDANTRHAIYGLNLNGFSQISNSSFNFSPSNGVSANGSAIDLQGQEGSILNLNSSTIDGFSIGVHVNDIDLRGECNTIESNDAGIKAENAIVYLNNDASNTFRWNESSNIILSGSSNGGGIYLLEGFNQFDLPLTLSSSFRHIDGLWNCYMPYTDYSSNYQFANFNYNKFQVPVNGIFPNISDYFELNVTSCSNPLNLEAGISVDLTEDNNSGPNCNSGPAVDLHPSHATLGTLSATSGKVSNGQFFNEAPLAQALDQALSQLSFGEVIRDDKGALETLIAILQGNISNQDANSQAYLNLAYNAMHQALNQSYQQDQLHNNEGEPSPPVEELDDVIEIVDNWLLPLSFSDSTDHAEIFRLNLDKVHAFRVGGHYNEALAVLSNRETWSFDFVQSQRAGYWNCVCQQEQSYFSGEIPAEEFNYGLDLCRQSFAGYAYKRGGETQRAETLTNNSIEAYPQPVVDVLTIQMSNMNVEALELKIYSLGGQLMKMETINRNDDVFKLDMSNFKGGVYIIHLDSGVGKEVLKVLKQ